MGNFNNVSMGLGTLSINSIDVGYLKEKVNYKYNYDIEQFKTGVPLLLRGQQVKELTSQLEASIAEITAANFAMAVGGLTVTAQTTTPVTITMQPFTMATAGGYGLQKINVGPGPGRANTFSAVTVKNAAESTTYTAGTDYLLDPTTGDIWRNPAGSITSLQALHVTATYVPITGNRVDLGATFSLAQVPVVFTHTRPNTLYTVVVNLWLATANGQLDFNFEESKFIINNIKFDAVYDSSHATSPLGYFYEQTA